MDLTTPQTGASGELFLGTSPSSNLTGISAEQWRDVVEMTQRMFGATTIEETCDPEFPDDRYVVLTVQSELDPKAVVAQEKRWITELYRIATSVDGIRLLILPRS
jgi:hypothetical protein